MSLDELKSTDERREHSMYYSVPQVAHALNVNGNTIRRLIEAEKLSGHRVGRQYRIFHGDIISYLGLTSPTQIRLITERLEAYDEEEAQEE